MLTKYLAAAAGNAEVSSWLYSFASTTNFWPFDIAVDSQDNIIVVGRTSEDGAGGTDGLIMKIDKGGNELWSKTYGDAGLNQRINAVHIDSSDNIFVAGQTHSLESNGWWMKLDSDGVIQIEKSISEGTGSYSYEACYDIQTDSSGNIYVFAELERNNGGVLYGYILLYNSSGTLLDSDYFNQLTYVSDSASATRQPRPKGAVAGSGLIGWAGRFTFLGSENAWFGKWVRSFNSLSNSGNSRYISGSVASNPGISYSQPMTGVKIDSNDNFYFFASDTISGSDCTVIHKYNLGFGFEDSKSLGYTNNFQYTASNLDANENLYVGNNLGVLCKLDTNLNLDSSIRITTASTSWITGVAGLSDGTVAVCGRDTSNRTFVARLNTNGESNNTYGSWTVSSYTTTNSSSVISATVESTYGAGHDIDDTITETDPNYTEASATITYTKY